MKTCFRAMLAAAVLGLLAPAAAHAQGVNRLLFEDFETTVLGSMPMGWTNYGNGWEVSPVSSASPATPNNLAHIGRSAGTVMLPPLDLRGLTSATLVFLARRTDGYDRTGLKITAALDDSFNFTTVVAAAGTALPAVADRYEEVRIGLPPAALGHRGVRLMFEATGGSSASSSIRFDDVAVVVPALDADAASLALQAAPGATASAALTVTLRRTEAHPLRAWIVGTTAFSVSPGGPVEAAPQSATAFTVTFAPQTEGVYRGTLVVADDVADTLRVRLDGATPGAARFGFGAAPARVLASTEGITAPLDLVFADPKGLQGLQFALTWDADVAQAVEVVRGRTVADATRWRFSTHTTARRIDVVLVGDGTTALEPARYDSLLLVRLTAGAVADSARVRLEVSGIVGALAVPTADDAGLASGKTLWSLRVERGYGRLGLPQGPVELPPVAVGASAQATLTLTNGGTLPLVVREATVDHPLFTLSPASAVVAPLGQQEFTLTFTPTATRFGRQTATVSFVHDGDGPSPATLEVRGHGTGGRGDTDADGLVDVADLVDVIDYVLGRLAPSARQKGAADLYPFGTPDGRLDVRDLTVMAQALARGTWPDAEGLPALPPPPPGALAAVPPAPPAEATVVARYADGALGLHLVSTVPLRAAQVVLALDADALAAPSLTPPEGTDVLAGWDAGRLRLVVYRSDGTPLPPGDYRLATLVGRAPRGVAPVYLTAIDAERRRVAPALDASTATAVEAADVPGAFAVAAPYPNPFRQGGGAGVRLPLALPGAGRVAAAVYDALGRRVARLDAGLLPAGHHELAWDGCDGAGLPVAPGLYLVRVETGGRAATRGVLVVR